MSAYTPLDEKSTAECDIDHTSHFLPEIEKASAELLKLGFSLTPFSAQSHRVSPDAPLVPAGTGNRCVMLRTGYMEFLTPTHNTPNAEALRTAMRRYTGMHLIAFGTESPETDYQRLTTGDFAPLTPVALQREVDTESGRATARFTVVRVLPDAMAEGRIQFCQHHTRDVVWQPRWLTHANHAVGLAGVVICVADPAEAADRYARFTGLYVQPIGGAWRLDTARGYLLFVDPGTLQKTLGVTAPALPWIAACVIDSDDMAATRTVVNGSRLDERILVNLDRSLGGVMIFQPTGSSVISL